MKKFISIIAMASMLLASTTAQAQFSHSQNSLYTVFAAGEQRNYELTRDNVRRGDDYFRQGNYRLAQREYEDARRYNDDCRERKFISPRELDHKIDECVYAQNHRGMTRQEEARRRDEQASAAIVGAIIGAAIKNHTSEAKATPAPTATTASTANDELMHFEKNGISYDANDKSTQITRIERSEDKITIHFEFLDMKTDFCLSVNEGLYLKDHSTGRKIAPLSLHGINYKSSGKVHVTAGDCYDFSITFPAPADDCHSIDIVEPGQSGWKFYHIAI